MPDDKPDTRPSRRLAIKATWLSWALVVVGLLTWWSWNTLEVDASKLSRLGEALNYAAKFYPPSPDLFRSHWWELAETFAIAWLGTIVGLVFALPCGLLASRNLFPRWLTTPLRSGLALVRSIPSIIWALVFIVVVGFGPLAGVCALACYTTGYLGKMFFEIVEGLGADALEAHEAMGSSVLSRIRHVVVPSAANAMISQSIYMLEYNFRHSTVLGIVGAGGIGRMMLLHIETGEYDRFAAVLFIVLVVVVMLEELSSVIRRRFQDERFTAEPSWLARLWRFIRVRVGSKEAQ